MVIKGNSLIDLFLKVNQWLDTGKTIRKIEVNANDSKYYSYEARISVVKVEGENESQN